MLIVTVETRFYERGGAVNDLLRVVIGSDRYENGTRSGLVSISTIEVYPRGVFYPPRVVAEAFGACFPPDPRRANELFHSMLRQDIPSGEISPFRFTLLRKVGPVEGSVELVITPRSIRTTRSEFPGYFLIGEDIGMVANDLYVGLMPFVRTTHS